MAGNRRQTLVPSLSGATTDLWTRFDQVRPPSRTCSHADEQGFVMPGILLDHHARRSPHPPPSLAHL